MTLSFSSKSQAVCARTALTVAILLACLFHGCMPRNDKPLTPRTPGTLTYDDRYGKKATVLDLAGDWAFVNTGIGLDGALVRVKQSQNRVRGYWLHLDWALIDTYWKDRPENACGQGDLLFIGEISGTTITGKRFLCYPRFLSDPLICHVTEGGAALEILMVDWEGMPHNAKLRRRE